MLTTTLKQIRAQSPCAPGWRKLIAALGSDYGYDTPLPLARIVETNGVADALWAFRCVKGSKRVAVQFAVECAERALPTFEAKYPNDARPRNAVAAVRAWLRAPTKKNAVAAAYADADDAAERGWQEQRLIELCNKVTPKI